MMDKNFDSLVRKENTRVVCAVVKFDLQSIKTHYDDSLEQIKTLFDLADELQKNDKLTEAKNIWRAQVVFLVSAFDFFMHEITKFCLNQIFEGSWTKTDKYKNISIKLEIIKNILISGRDTEWFIEFVNEYYSNVTMVSYESVKAQFNLLGLNINALAKNVFHIPADQMKEKDKLKNFLDELFSKRNLIAHQFDRQHSDAQFIDIAEKAVKEYIKKTGEIVDAVVNQIKQKMTES